MTRQEKITAIGKCTPSFFEDRASDFRSKNQMSYFIIPLPHALYKNIEKDYLSKFEEMGWTLGNEQVEQVKGEETITDERNRLFMADPTNTGAIKSYIYDHMLPRFFYKKEKQDRSFTHFINDYNNMLFQKHDLAKKWQVESVKGDPFLLEIELDGIDLWLFNRHIAFFTLRTKQSPDDKTSVSDISSKINRVLREFREIYVDVDNHIFSNVSFEN